MGKNRDAYKKLADMGKQVRKRLARAANVRDVSQSYVEIFTVSAFASPQECDALVAMIDANARPSTLYAAEGEHENFRTSSSCDLQPQAPLVLTIEQRMCALMGVDPRHGETLQGQRYQPGQQFKPHQDYFPYEMDYWQAERLNGGQRSWTGMIFLNEPEAGGETNFPSAGLCFTPETGMLLLWNNMYPDGSPNTYTMHEGCPVLAGTKYIVTKWFRERFWLPGLR